MLTWSFLVREAKLSTGLIKMDVINFFFSFKFHLSSEENLDLKEKNINGQLIKTVKSVPKNTLTEELKEVFVLSYRCRMFRWYK